MANNILVSVEDNLAEPIWINKIEPFLQKVMNFASFDGEEISVLFCTDAFIRQLNAQFRNIDEATDVLSFENGDSYIDDEGQKWIQAGDIAISLETLPKNAEYFAVSPDEELKRLLIHGLLHLNGYDHGDEHVTPDVEGECEMFKIQKRLLEQVQDYHILEELE